MNYNNQGEYECKFHIIKLQIELEIALFNKLEHLNSTLISKTSHKNQKCP